eukprot:scaffold434_cov186-Pinguiococcus_pyrenoidosus.AAC.127
MRELPRHSWPFHIPVIGTHQAASAIVAHHGHARNAKSRDDGEQRWRRSSSGDCHSDSLGSHRKIFSHSSLCLPISRFSCKVVPAEGPNFTRYDRRFSVLLTFSYSFRTVAMVPTVGTCSGFSSVPSRSKIAVSSCATDTSLDSNDPIFRKIPGKTTKIASILFCFLESPSGFAPNASFSRDFFTPHLPQRAYPDYRLPKYATSTCGACPYARMCRETFHYRTRH